jgi:hypothetical protein
VVGLSVPTGCLMQSRRSKGASPAGHPSGWRLSGGACGPSAVTAGCKSSGRANALAPPVLSWPFVVGCCTKRGGRATRRTDQVRNGTAATPIRTRDHWARGPMAQANLCCPLWSKSVAPASARAWSTHSLRDWSCRHVTVVRRDAAGAEQVDDHVHALGRLRHEVEDPLRFLAERHGVRLERVDHVGELDGVPDEEHREVVADQQVPVAVLGVELHGEAARVAGGLRRIPPADHRREPDGDVGARHSTEA